MLDPLRARAEADAAERRGAGSLWGAGPVAWEGVTAGTVAQPEVVKRFNSQGAEPSPLASEEFAPFVKSEIAKWAKIVAETGMKAD